MRLADATLLLATVLLLGRASDAKSPEDRLAWMKNQAESSSGNLIRLGHTSFVEQILGSPRPYDTVVIFNARSPRFDCIACRGIGSDTKQIATSTFNAQKNSADVKTPLFVAELEFDSLDANVVFREINLNTAPLVVFVKSSTRKTPIAADKFLDNVKSKDEFDFNVKGFRAEDVVEWISDRAGLKISVDRPIDYGLIFRETVLPILIILLPFFLALPFLYRRRYDRRLYFAASLGIYLFSVSGGMFNILKDTPWHHHNRDGSVSYFHDGGGWQLGAESYICGGIQVFMGLILIALNTSIVELNSGKARNALAGLAVGTYFMMFSVLRGLITRKMGNYNYGWVFQW